MHFFGEQPAMDRCSRSPIRSGRSREFPKEAVELRDIAGLHIDRNKKNRTERPADVAGMPPAADSGLGGKRALAEAPRFRKVRPAF